MVEITCKSGGFGFSDRNRVQRKTRSPTFFQFHLRIIAIPVIISSFPVYDFSGYMFVRTYAVEQ